MIAEKQTGTRNGAFATQSGFRTMNCPGNREASLSHSNRNFKTLPLTFTYTVQPNPTNTESVTFSAVALIGFGNWHVIDSITLNVTGADGGNENPPSPVI